MTIWNPKEFEELKEIYASFKELMDLKTQIQIKETCLIDRAWNLYFDANK